MIIFNFLGGEMLDVRRLNRKLKKSNFYVIFDHLCKKYCFYINELFIIDNLFIILHDSFAITLACGLDHNILSRYRFIFQYN